MKNLTVLLLIIFAIAIFAFALIFHAVFKWIDSLLGTSISGQISPIVPIIITVIIIIAAIIIFTRNKGNKR